jgi:hypothetical protein
MANIDDKITELFKVVRRQKEEVETAEKESKQSWKTNCSIHFDIVVTPINIQTASEITVKKIVIELLKYKEFSRQAEELLGLENTTHYDGFSYSDWFADCKKRITVIGLRAKKDKLAEVEKRLKAIISPEQIRQMELDAITESLNV